MPIFKFKDEEALGKVASVDTANVIVEVENVDQLKRLQVNHLAVLQSSRPGQHLIGLITQVTRKRGIEDVVNDGVNDQAAELAESIIKCNTQPVRYRDGQALRTTHG